MLATLNGLVGGLHYGFGKGTGSLLGGFIISASGSTAYAFRVFGFASVALAVLYIFYWYVIRRCVSADHKDVPENNNFGDEEPPSEEKEFLAPDNKSTKEKELI